MWGQPVLDYDLTVEANTTLRVIKNTYDNNPVTLTLSAGRTLTNHGEVHVEDDSKVVMQEGAGALNNTCLLYTSGLGHHTMGKENPQWLQTAWNRQALSHIYVRST